uniref:S100/CaBP-9k-type calcium binding subdomain domain-containing protein n=1 Tax=Eptatretus burgeri TaxID=7764 RepID=A0A8C4R771_EPTBU
MVTDLEMAMQTLIEVFHKHAKRAKASVHHLDRDELKHLVPKELSLHDDKMKELLQRLQNDSERGLDFKAFYSLIVGLTLACNQCYEDHINKHGGGITASKEDTS